MQERQGELEQLMAQHKRLESDYRGLLSKYEGDKLSAQAPVIN